MKKFKKLTAALSALVMGATMMAGTAMSASAEDYIVPDDENPIITVVNDVIYYSDGEFRKANGDPAPLNMGTACINDVSTDDDGFVTIDLKTGYVSIWNWNLISVTIEDCKLLNGTTIYDNGDIVIDPDYITVVYDGDDVDYGYVDVTVYFGGGLASIIGLTPMTNPMNMRIILF